ncbi:hypothetical protein BC826DRAFT_336397 [Russula brevipes]|nr:hypothetical protein BC826DRAFT_336397 [Russula brevipes]
MAPRPSISGEIPIDSYFGSAGRAADSTLAGNKENSSLKRRSGTDQQGANRTSTKKQRIKQPSKCTNLDTQETSFSVTIEAQPKPGSSGSRTTSLPTPVSVAKLPPSASSRVPVDVEVLTLTTSSPPPRTTSLNAEDAARHAGNTESRTGLPTPQTVCHEGRQKLRTDAAAHFPTASTASRSVMQMGFAIPSPILRPPLTPPRSKSKSNSVALARRTTPHSQRIVPSSQWSDDEQPSSAPSLEEDRNPFLLRHTDEPDSCTNAVALPPPYDVGSRPPSGSSRTPVKLKTSVPKTLIEPHEQCSLKNSYDSGSMTVALRTLQSVPLSSSGCALRYQNQSSQIVPTSQLEEIELEVRSQGIHLVCPGAPPQTNHFEMMPSVERCSRLFVFSLAWH